MTSQACFSPQIQTSNLSNEKHRGKSEMRNTVCNTSSGTKSLRNHSINVDFEGGKFLATGISALSSGSFCLDLHGKLTKLSVSQSQHTSSNALAGSLHFLPGRGHTRHFNVKQQQLLFVLPLFLPRHNVKFWGGILSAIFLSALQ